MITIKMPKIKIHYSLLIYIILCTFTGFFKDFIIIFGILMFHELGHIMMIKLFKGKIKKITLSIIGGLMDIELTNNKIIPNLLISFARPS